VEHGRLGAHMTPEERARAERVMINKLEVGGCTS
jgi:hypothetical protein